MSDVDIVVSIEGRSEGGRVIKRTLDDVSQSADKATGKVGDLDKRLKDTRGTADLMARSFTGLIGALSVRELMRASDAFVLLKGRLDNSTRSAEESRQALEGLRSTAIRTGTEIETVVSIFQRLSFVRDEIKATVGDMLQFTDTVSKLGVVSGASQSAMQAGLMQLGQSLSNSIVRAEEFNSIMENIPAVGVAIAKQFGVTTGQLRQLVIQGQVLSEDVFSALLNSSKEVEQQFDKMGMTGARALNALTTEMEALAGQSSQTSGAAAAVVGVIDTLRVAVFGLGVAFNGAVEIVAYSGTMIVKNIEDMVNGSLNKINWMIRQVNQLPGVNIEQFGGVDWVGGEGVSAANISEEFRSRMKNVANAKPPENTVFSRMAGETSSNAASSTRELTQNYKELAETVGSGAGKSGKGKSVTDAHKELESAISGARTEEEKLLDKIKGLEGMRGMAMTAKESEGLKTAIERANGELDDLRIQVERNGPIAKGLESLANNIDDGIRESFREAFVASDGGWKDMINSWKAGFKAFLAELAYAAFAKPIVLSFVGALGGALGLSSGATSGITGDLGGGIGGLLGGGTGGGFSLSNLSSLGSGLLNGGLYSNTLGGVGTGIGNFLSGNGYGFIGPSAPGSLASIGGSAFGNLGYGAIGSLGASLFGLGGGIGGSIGGGLGSLAGGAFGGPIGAIAGGFLGSALGGLFGGGKPSDATAEALINFGNPSAVSRGDLGSKTSKQNLDYREAILKQINDTLALVGQYGGTATGGGGYIQIGNREGLRYQNKSYGMNQDAFQSAIFTDLRNSITGLTGTFKTIFDNIGINDLSGLSEAFAFGQSYDALVKPKENVDALQSALDALKTQFDGLITQATSYGLSITPLTEEYERQKKAVTELVKAQQAGFASLEAMKQTFDSWLYDQSLSSVSSLTPSEKFAKSQENFGSLLELVRGGDASKTQELLQAGQQLLQIGQGMYASSVDFSLMEKFVRESISSIARDLGVPGYATGTMSARAGMAWVGERGPELVRFNGGERVYNAEESKAMARSSAANDSRFAEVAKETSAMRQDISRMTKQLSRVANQMIAQGNK